MSGEDECGELGNEQCFQGRRACKGYDFDVLDLLTTAGEPRQEFAVKIATALETLKLE